MGRRIVQEAAQLNSASGFVHLVAIAHAQGNILAFFFFANILNCASFKPTKVLYQSNSKNTINKLPFGRNDLTLVGFVLKWINATNSTQVEFLLPIYFGESLSLLNRHNAYRTDKNAPLTCSSLLGTQISSRICTAALSCAATKADLRSSLSCSTPAVMLDFGGGLACRC